MEPIGTDVLIRTHIELIWVRLMSMKMMAGLITDGTLNHVPQKPSFFLVLTKIRNRAVKPRRKHGDMKKIVGDGDVVRPE